MRRRIDWRPADTLPGRRDVLALQGIPAGIEPSGIGLGEYQAMLKADSDRAAKTVKAAGMQPL